jgi:hypothetical protein
LVEAVDGRTETIACHWVRVGSGQRGNKSEERIFDSHYKMNIITQNFPPFM